MVETLTRNWGWVALRGIAAILFGVLTLFNPGITLAALILMFGAYAIVDGVFTVVAAIAHRHGRPYWFALLLGGLLGIAAGIVTFAMPGVTALVLLAVIAAWAIVTGIAEIVAAIRLRKVIAGEWLFVFSGLLTVTLGVVLLARPGVGALAMVLWIGAWALVSGIVLTVFGFRLRRWSREHPARVTPHPA